LPSSTATYRGFNLIKELISSYFNCRDVEIYHLQKGKNVEGGVIQVKHTTIDIKVVRLLL
jgi:hypothetical protein